MMFRTKFGKNEKTLLAVDDSRTVAHDFKLRATVAGFESYIPADYKLYYKLNESLMMLQLEQHLKHLFTGGMIKGQQRGLLKKRSDVFRLIRNRTAKIKVRHII